MIVDTRRPRNLVSALATSEAIALNAADELSEVAAVLLDAARKVVDPALAERCEAHAHHARLIARNIREATK